jgi:multiple sugar transport system substrate-binding protein
LSAAFPPDTLASEFLPGPVETSVLEGRTFGVPWYADVGVMYRRTDLVPEAPSTTEDLAARAREIAKTSETGGYVWQGRQYEGLVCNAFEAFWAHGAERGDPLQLDTPEAIRGLTYLRELILTGASPRSVTSMAEEDARRVFVGRRGLHAELALRASRAREGGIAGPRAGRNLAPSQCER